MLHKLCHVFVKLSLILCFANARSAVLESVITQLPGSLTLFKNLADRVCSELDIFEDRPLAAAACPDNFLSPVKDDSYRPKVKVRCRLSEKSVYFEVTPSDRRQLVALIPEISEEDDVIKYSIIKPNVRFGQINDLEPSRNYIITSTVLNKDGRPSHWHGEVRVPAWSETPVPEPRSYDVQVQFVNYSRANYGVITGVVTWNHTGDSDVCFFFTNFCNGKMKYMSIWPYDNQTVILENLPLDGDCQLQLDGMYGTTDLKYRTPARDAYKDKDVIVNETSNNESWPEIPREISLEAVEDGDAWKVRVWWAEPRDSPGRYNVTLGADHYATLVVPGNATEAIFTNVTGEGLYNVTVYAFKGQHKAQNFTRAVFPGRVAWRSHWALAAGAAWCALALSGLAVALYWQQLRRRPDKEGKPKDPEGNPLGVSVDSLEIECDEQWEVRSERLHLHEVIGEGAFGVVRRGSLAPAGKEVAVKMLKEYPARDEVRAFLLEMELMKSVGAHPHVVSLVGCCSGKRPLIIAEYCARGDLLSFLRCSWDVMVSKRNAKYYNNNIETDYRNDLFQCKIQREPAANRLVVNKMYDLQSMCDADLTSSDLLSFCRQIAMGMEFLASNRLVHRDLAARNVLVTGDKTLKIADFGLSRDVYEENQYKQTGNEKMPVKWMALESLTRRIYTSQSDVWSFGVVLWEVVTVGGSPYPEVPAARLPRLLRAGYRMPRPPNCSKQMYDLMLCCWRSHPRERPTFVELHARLDELLNCACADEYLRLELDDEAPPTPKAQRYFNMIIRGKRAWTRESYERPLKAVQSNHNHYTSLPVILSKAPV